jgi:hypothetical protein
MELSRRYKWEAETAGGEIITAGAFLRNCVRFSLIPEAPGLQRVDIVGVPLRRRFCRGFTKAYLNLQKELPGLFFWKHGDNQLATSEDVSGELSPGDVIGKAVAGDEWYTVLRVEPNRIVLSRPYSGKSKPKGFRAKKLAGAGRPRQFYFHCVETDSTRVWVDYQTGNVLVTTKNYEHYL